MSFCIGPDPYLDWMKPYTLAHIQQSLKNRNKIDNIQIVAWGTHVDVLERVCIVEAPVGFWVAWLNGTSIAYPISAKNSDFQNGLDAQKKALEIDGAIDFIKVPECSDFLVDSGPASILNAEWLSQNKRKGHPGSQAYLDVRKDDMQTWLTNTSSH